MSRRIVLTFLTCFLLAPAMLKAQPAPDGGCNAGADQGNRRNRGGGGGQGGGNFDPAAMRQNFLDRIKEQMGAKDDEWKVIEPKLTKVMDAQRSARAGGFGFGGFGGRGGGGGGGGNRGGANADTPTAKAMQDLRETLDNKDASADDIAKKLTALRDARDKARAELLATQKDLKEILTQRQEAVLVMMGQLE
jgi:hypothetical protein